ncbi:MAG: arsenate reductase (glutaredoxin) [Bacteriovoracia bacterium]
MSFTIYHNPRCSKSREALALLEAEGIKPKVVEYLAEPPSETELLLLISILDAPFASLVRSKDEKYRKLNFDLSTKESVAKHLALHPELLERPIVVKNNRAVLGRPPENIKKLF